MTIPILQIDAFADRPFAGNPAAVCLLDEPGRADWMRDVAAEMNLSETAFVCPAEGAAGEFGLRWFTPACEVRLCGHATLASAHALWETGRVEGGMEIRFRTASGVLTARPDGPWIELDFPARPCEAVAEAPEGLADALGAKPAAVCAAVGSVRTWLVELADEAEVRALAPDFRKLRAVEGGSAIVTSRADSSEFDFVSRFFAPIGGVDEDPVTGSAHCCLGPYWRAKLGKDDLVARQVSRRGGTVLVAVRGERVLLRGRAVTTLRGELTA